MAKLLLINATSYTDKDNREVGDIVGIFEDKHVFSAHEKEIFDIVDFPGDAKTISQNLMPKVRTVFRSATLNWTEDLPEEKRVWDDAGDLKEISVEPRFYARYDQLTATIKNNFSRYSGNSTVLIPKKVVVK